MIDPKRLAYIEKRFNHNRQAIIDILELSDEHQRNTPMKKKSPGQVACEYAYEHGIPAYSWNECDQLLKKDWHRVARAVIKASRARRGKGKR